MTGSPIEYPSNHDRLVVFDCDGVLAHHKGSWATIHEKMETVDHQQEYLRRYKNGTVGMEEWSQRTVENWAGRSSTNLDAAVAEAVAIDGLCATFERLKDRLFAIGIVSAGVMQYVEQVVGDAPVDFIISNHIETVDGEVTGTAEIRVTDGNKVEWFREAVAGCGVPESNVVLVGDAPNDLAKVHPENLAIAFNPRSETVAEVADHVITSSDLGRIIDPIDRWLETTGVRSPRFSE